MQTKPLLYGIVGFLLGGLIVSIAAATFEKKDTQSDMSTMVSSLEGKTGDDFDKAFVSGMIDHHQDAIDMARMADKQAKHQEVKELSKAIIDTQQKEIDQMRHWQATWGYPSSQASPMEH
jgi:uncharacterized protein (DUF305 family)